jgi:hypothetical protein
MIPNFLPGRVTARAFATAPTLRTPYLSSEPLMSEGVVKAIEEHDRACAFVLSLATSHHRSKPSW